MQNESTTSRDCAVEIFDDIRASRPPIYDGDAWQSWLCAIGDCISALPTQQQRWAATVLVANDLVLAMPGLSLAMAHLSILEAVMKASLGGVREDVRGLP